MIEFQPFPKLARLSRGCVITEKIDGTNAQVIIRKLEDKDLADALIGVTVERDGALYEVAAGSRTRLITPGNTSDNFGFAAWVFSNGEALLQLGEGRHFGEWYGQGIQRGYGLTEKRFALFNPERWPAERVRPACVSVVPVLWEGEFTSGAIDFSMGYLKDNGSIAAAGFMNPEGIVVWHEAARVSFKKTFDDKHKEAA